MTDDYTPREMRLIAERDVALSRAEIAEGKVDELEHAAVRAAKQQHDARVDRLNPIDCLAHQLYMQGLNGGMSVLWLVMDDAIRAEWRRHAEDVLAQWRERETKAEQARQEHDKRRNR